MAQDIFNTIDPNTTSGTQLATLLVSFKDALISNSSGAARPSEIAPQGTWVQIVDANTWQLYMFDGTDDILLLTVNPTLNTVKFPDSADTFGLTRQSADSIGPILEMVKKRDTGATQVGDELGSIEFKGFDGSVEYTQARIKTISLDITSATEQGAYTIFETTSEDSTALTEAMRIAGNGSIGIGNVATPEKKLHVRSTTALAGGKFVRDQDVAGGAEVLIKKKRGVTDNGQTKLGDSLGKYSFYGTDETGAEALLAEIETVTEEDTSTTNHGASLVIRTKVAGGTALQEAIKIDSGNVTILGQEQNDQKQSIALQDDTLTRNLFSIDGTIYKSFKATIQAWGLDTIGPDDYAQAITINGVYNGTTWYFTNDDSDLAGNGLLVELSYTNAATLVVDYVNQIASGDFDSGNIYLDLVRNK